MENIPFELRFLQAKQDIAQAVNSAAKVYKIPFVILDTVLSDIAKQVQQMAVLERDTAQKNYENALKEKASMSHETDNADDGCSVDSDTRDEDNTQKE